jgi:hypothetical protein
MKKHWKILIPLALLGVVIGFFIGKQTVYSPHTTTKISPTTSTVSPAPTQNPNANIIVLEPKPQTILRVPFFLQGKARVFENQLNYRILDEDGSVLTEGNITASGGEVGQLNPFETKITYLPPPNGKKGMVEVFDYSPKDGAQIDTVRVRVRFK